MAEKKKPIQLVAPAEDKKKALETALSHIDKQYGKGSIMRLGETLSEHVEALDTGSLSLNIALGIGGVPRGRIIEIYGPEASGKTTLALHIVASAQKAGGIAAYIDVEHALEPAYAKSIGVNIDDLLIAQPGSGEDALAICDTLVRSGALDCVVVDSVAALVPRAELEGEVGDPTVGVVARLMSQALRKLAGGISRTNCIVIFINQLREKIGVMYGNPETTPGGKALKYFASVRIDIRKDDVIKEGSEITGVRARAKVVKNKVAPPFKTAYFDIVYGQGISRFGEVVDYAIEIDAIEKSGSWFTVDGQRMQGKDAVKDYLRAHPEVVEDLEIKIMENQEKIREASSTQASEKGKKSSAGTVVASGGEGVDIIADDFPED
ncbi:MAG: recombinase RecA [Oscillospiraceae bacterium]|jgi:recombination protein RecA|nr:recombinase RecA [Oscillospiraceae bacterium]